LVWDVIEPVISREEWEEFQEILKANQKKFATGKINRKYLFSGLISCSCGGHILEIYLIKRKRFNTIDVILAVKG